MKILHINERYGYNGGSETYMNKLCFELSKQGYDISVLFDFKDNISFPNIKEYCIKGINLPHSKNLKDNIDKLHKVIDIDKPDIITIHNLDNYYAIESIINLKIPTVRIVQNLTLFCPSGWKILHRSDKVCNYSFGWKCAINAYFERCINRRPDKLFNIMKNKSLELKINRKCNKLVVLSNYMKNCLVQNGFDKDKIDVIPPAVEANLNISQYNNNDKNILFVGRVCPEKGLDLIIKNLLDLPKDIKLTVIGDGPTLNDNIKLAKSLGVSDRISFLGQIENNKLAKYYESATIVVFPSIWQEPFGIVGLEAMAHGKPVVAFDVGGVSEWLEDGKNGFLIQRNDIKRLIDKIKELIMNKNMAEYMGKEGYQKVKKEFSTETYINKYRRLYNENISSNNNI